MKGNDGLVFHKDMLKESSTEMADVFEESDKESLGDKDSSTSELEIVEDREFVFDDKESTSSSSSDEDFEKKKKQELDKEAQKKSLIEAEKLLEESRRSSLIDKESFISPLTFFATEDRNSNPLLNKKFVDKYGTEVKSDYVLKDKEVIGLLFSTYHCARGKKILPSLKQIYESAGKMKLPFEIVYVSYDYSKSDMMDALRHDHGNWFGIEYGEPVREILRYMYDILAVPHLIVINQYGGTITRTGIQEVESIGLNVLVTWF